MIKIKTKEEIDIMAEAGKILAEIMKELTAKVKPGVSTKDLDKTAERLVLRYGAKPSFKNYDNFPAVLCTCINEEVVHCVPCSRKLNQGDIISLDMGILYKGYHSDMAVTLPVGQISEEAQRLIRVTKKALKRGIKKVRPGITFGDIGNTIQRYAEGQGYGVIRDLCGHGIGKDLHEEPEVFNYGKRKTGPIVKQGMVFCLEPMISKGDWHIKKAQDGYGFQTKDGSLSAHFEHTIVGNVKIKIERFPKAPTNISFSLFVSSQVETTVGAFYLLFQLYSIILCKKSPIGLFLSRYVFCVIMK